MIIARMYKPDDPDAKMLFLGLDAENIRRFRDHKMIELNLADYGMGDIDVVIAYADTQEEMIAFLNPMTRPETVKHYMGPGEPPAAYQKMDGMDSHVSDESIRDMLAREAGEAEAKAEADEKPEP